MTMLRTGKLLSLCLGVVCSMPFVASPALGGTPRLNRVTPPGGQRGSTVEVTLQGRFLEQPREVLFYESGITAEALEPVEGDRVKVRLKLAADCPLGPHGLRLCTASGVSDYQRFFVGPFPTLEEEEQPQKRNDTRETARAVPLNSTILGRIGDPTDVDLYRIEVQAGQRLSAELEAARLGVERGIPDLHLAVYDADGKKLAGADDSALFLQDPLLSLLAPRAGVYFVEVRHCMYRGANETYRLHVGTFPRPIAVYPAGGPAGTTLSIELLGDPRGVSRQTVQLPKEPGEIAFVAVDGGVSAPSPNMLRVSPFPNVLETEPNDTPEGVPSTSPASLPAAFNGIINRPGDVDCFRFRAKKGEQYRFHALANALGSPVDPTIWIKPANAKPGAAAVRATDARANQLGLSPIDGASRNTLDPVLEFTVPADGEYILGVENDRGEGGSEHVYRVEVQLDSTAIFTYLPPEPDNRFMPQLRQAIAVPAGNRYTTQVAVFTTNRPIAGELELAAIGLPPGVTLHAPKITPTMTRVPVLFEAAADAKPQAALVDLVVRPAAGSKQPPFASGYRQVIPMNQYGNNDFYLHTVVDKLVVAVAEPAPFRIQVEEPKSALVQNGEMGIKFTIERASGFDGPVTVQMEWRPNGISTMTPVTIPAGQSEGQYLLGAARNAPAGTYQVALTAMSGGARQGYYEVANRIYVASQPFRLRVAEPHIEARIARTSIERGKTAQVVCRLTHLQPFTGKAKATLGRLPRGVELVEPVREVTSEDKEVTFTLRATPECLVGNYQGIVLDVTVLEDGQAIRQLSGYGVLRIDGERGTRTTAR